MDFIAMAETLEAQASALRREAARIAAVGQAELELAPAEPEWIVWEGGEQPPETYGKTVDYKLRNDGETIGYPAAAINWSWDDSGPDPFDIVAYRISADQPVTP